MAIERALSRLAILVAVLLIAQAAWAEPTERASVSKVDPHIAQAIENLGSDSAETAQAAESDLIESGDQAIPALAQAIRSDKAKVAERAKQIVARQVARQIENLGSRTEKVAQQAEASLIQCGYLSVLELERTVKNDPERAARAKSALQGILPNRCLVFDAIGNPIFGAEVQFRWELRRKPDEPKRTIMRVSTVDESGSISVEPPEDCYNALARLRHPDFGEAQLAVWQHEGAKVLQFPLVHKDSVEAKRSLRGAIRRADDKPIVGALIVVSSVRTPGMGLIQTSDRPMSVTNADGHFTYYPIASLTKRIDLPALVPPSSKYSFVVRTPDEPELFPCSATHDNQSDATVKLERAERFHRFSFANPAGGVLTVDESKKVWITYAKGPTEPSVLLDTNWSVTGAKLLPGVYSAHYINAPYAPLTVTKDSPEELAVQFKPAITMRGRVTNGITGEPMAGAFVVGVSAIAQGSLSKLTESEWETLRELPADAQLSDSRLAPLKRCYSLGAFTRTDAAGAYALTQRAEAAISSIVAVQKDFLAISQSKQGMTAIANVTAVPNLPLFPAAKVFARTVSAQPGIIYARWRFADDGQPEWFQKLLAATDHKLQRSMASAYQTVDARSPILVPADVRLKIEFSPRSDEVSRVTTPDVFQLKAGDSRDIGEIALPAAIPVVVAVMDEQKKPVADVVVRRIYDNDNTWSLPHLTDVDGCARFFVSRNSSGRLAVAMKNGMAGGKNDQPANVVAAFEIKETASDDPLKITLTADQLKDLKQQREKP